MRCDEVLYAFGEVDITFFAVCDMFPEFGEDGVAPCFVDCSNWGDGFGCEFEDDDFSSEFEASVHFGECFVYICCISDSPCAGDGVEALCGELGFFHVVLEEGCLMEKIFFCGELFSYIQHVGAEVCYCCVFSSALEEFDCDICGTSCCVPEGFVGEGVE